MTAPAQTNAQLFQQLAQLGHDAADLAQARDAYVLAMNVFAGLHRSCGKPFVAHAVGTASVVADAGGSADLVAAALLHSAYTLGEFGTLRRRIDARKRARVRAAAGAHAERLVDAYASFAWHDADIAALLEREPPQGIERDVLLLRLANEVDEYANLAALYAWDRDRRIDRAERVLPQCAALAERIGHSRLAERIRIERASTLAQRDAPAPPSTRSGISSLVAPASHAPRPHVLLQQLIDTVRRSRDKAGRGRVR